MKKKILQLLLGLSLSTFAYSQQALSVEEAWQYAANHNVNIQKAKIDRTIADQKVKETIGIGLPQINAKGTYNYFIEIPVQLLPAAITGGAPGDYIPVQFGQKHTAKGEATLSQIIFNGSYLVGLESSQTYKETAQLIEEKTELSLKEGILQAYTGVLVTEENIKTLEENRRSLAQSVYETEKTYEVGLIELQDVEQLQYSYKSLETNIDNLKRTKDKLKMSLKFILGYPLEQDLILTSTLDELIEKNIILVDTENTTVNNHIDYRLKRNQFRLSELQLKLEKSKALPSLSGFLNTSYNGNSNEFTFFDRSQQWFNTTVVGLQLDIPIFSGLQRHWKTEQAKLEVEKAEMDMLDTERDLKNQIYSGRIDYDNAYNSFKNAEDLIELSSSIFKKQQIKFKEGMGTSFDLHQAESQLYNSQREYYNAALNLIQARIKLDQSLGRL